MLVNNIQFLCRDPQSSEAWKRLGEAHAENDRDDHAIAALYRGVTANPE